MSKITDRLSRTLRHRRARRELRRKAKNWRFGDGTECAEQGGGTLGRDFLQQMDADKARRRLKRFEIKQLNRARENERLFRAERREAQCRRYL